MPNAFAVVLCSLALSAVASSVSAQADAGQEQARRNAGVREIVDRREGQNLAVYMHDLQARRTADANPRRLRRAQAAAALVNAGDCASARSLATRDNDQRMVLRIDQVCASATPAA